MSSDALSTGMTQAQRDLALLGKCPYCEQSVRGWKPVFGAFAPEWWATMREHGIDGANGHRENCAHKDIRL
jgi:hypothetical protein